MKNLTDRHRITLLAGLTALPAVLGTLAANANGGGGVGGGNPACLIAGTATLACDVPKSQDNGPCPDDYIEDGDCPHTGFDTAGLTGPPHNFTVDCRYRRIDPDPNGGCITDPTERTFHAACSQPDGTSCPP